MSLGRVGARSPRCPAAEERKGGGEVERKKERYSFAFSCTAGGRQGIHHTCGAFKGKNVLRRRQRYAASTFQFVLISGQFRRMIRLLSVKPPPSSFHAPEKCILSSSPPSPHRRSGGGGGAERAAIALILLLLSPPGPYPPTFQFLPK